MCALSVECGPNPSLFNWCFDKRNILCSREHDLTRNSNDFLTLLFILSFRMNFNDSGFFIIIILVRQLSTD